MSASEETQEMTEFVAFWNEVLVPKFVKSRHILVGGLSHHSEKIFPTLRVKDGDKVLDVGCGFGDTAIQFGTIVGPKGTVLGIDCCDGFTNIASDDAKAAGADNVKFQVADAQSHQFDSDYDFCFSRFGTQFFENPVAGLRNMRASLKPGGIMTMIVWRTAADNPWLGLPKDIILKILPAPGDDGRSCGPGPFSMADQEMVTKQLEVSGYTDIEFKRVDAPLMVGNSLDDAIAFQLAVGPAGEVYREAGDEAIERHDEIDAAFKAELAKYQTPEGIILDSSSWVISAVNPG
jgi:ubiquinone/menaquinone biosynthesis C-methylase UbiE